VRPPAADLRRVVVIGISGAGKSTVARRLAAVLAAPHIELDALYWGPGWTRRPAFRDDVGSAAQAGRWVIDGNYESSRELVWPHATTVLWLNLSFAQVFWRVLRRTLRRIFRREVLWGGNRESLARSFCSRESILWWVLTMYHQRRREFAARRAAQGALPAWIELRTPRDVERWLRSLDAIEASAPQP
jgi:adenylate kinase family enzyme